MAQELATGGQRLQLELGGGSNSKPGWINVDLSAKDSLALDLRRLLPFPEGSVDSIYSEHVLEHFTYPEGFSNLLSECYRVLKPGGMFQAGIPDAGLAFRAYAASHATFYQQKYWSNVDPGSLKSPMDELNWLIYMGGVHHTMFDRQNIVMLLEEAGFADVGVRNFDPRLDSDFRKHQTMYVVARKPSGEPQSPSAIFTAHIEHILDDMMASSLLGKVTGRLTTHQRYRVLRILMLIAGRWGQVLVVGDNIEPFLEVLSILSVPGADCLYGLTSAAENRTDVAGEKHDGIRYHKLSKIPYPDKHFTQMIVVDNNDRFLSRDFRIEMYRVLRSGGKLFWIASAGRVESHLDGFSWNHSEELPSDAGTLHIFDKVKGER